MFKYYLKSALRSLWNNPGHTLINMLGLSMGLLTVTLIALWVQSELRYDRFYTHSDRLYQIFTADTFQGEKHAWGGTPAVLGPRLAEAQPDIEAMVRTASMSATLGAANERFSSSGQGVDSAFFKLFDFKFIQGDPGTALRDPDDVVITRSLAKRLFGSRRVLGETLALDTGGLVQVTGVIEDVPHNSRFSDTEFFCSWSYLENRNQIYYKSWTAYNHSTYVLLRQGASELSVNDKIREFVPGETSGEVRAEIFLHPAAKWHLYNRSENGKMVAGRIKTLEVFMIAGIFILLIAAVNFINLSTARSEKRAKEIGVRKVIGARKNTLVLQFLVESTLLALLAAVLAGALILLVHPWFTQLINERLELSDVPFWFWLAYTGLALFTGLAAGIYPALVLSAFLPVHALKAGLSRAGGNLTPRRVLVVLQFTISIFLTICTLVVARQIRYGQDRDIGYNKEQLIYARLNGALEKNFTPFRQELLSSGAATHVSKNQGPVSRYSSNSWGFSWPGATAQDYDVVFNTMSTDRNFSEIMGIQIVKGRDIDIQQFPGDSTALLINEAAAKRMGLDDPIGKQITKGEDEYLQKWTIVGVIGDYILESPYDKIEPMIVFGPAGWFGYMHIRLNPEGSLSANLETIRTLVKKYNPDYPFDYQFADADYARKFAKEKQTARLTGIFSALAILIASLGLLGLVTHTVQQRSKELGIRKVLGATISSLLRLLTSDLITLVILAMLIACPLAWWVMQKWLDNYTYHMDIAWWMLLSGGILGIGIAFLSVAFQALRAARSNPVRALRDE